MHIHAWLCVTMRTARRESAKPAAPHRRIGALVMGTSVGTQGVNLRLATWSRCCADHSTNDDEAVKGWHAGRLGTAPSATIPILRLLLMDRPEFIVVLVVSRFVVVAGASFGSLPRRADGRPCSIWVGRLARRALAGALCGPVGLVDAGGRRPARQLACVTFTGAP